MNACQRDHCSSVMVSWCHKGKSAEEVSACTRADMKSANSGAPDGAGSARVGLCGISLHVPDPSVHVSQSGGLLSALHIEASGPMADWQRPPAARTGPDGLAHHLEMLTHAPFWPGPSQRSDRIYRKAALETLQAIVLGTPASKALNQPGAFAAHGASRMGLAAKGSNAL